MQVSERESETDRQKRLLAEEPFFFAVLFFAVFLHFSLHFNPFRTPVPFWGQITWN